SLARCAARKALRALRVSGSRSRSASRICPRTRRAAYAPNDAPRSPRYRRAACTRPTSPHAMRSSRSAPRQRGSIDREATARANCRCAMMRSSPRGTAGSAMRTSPAARTVVRPSCGVNSRLTKLSTKAEGFYRRYRYPDWLESHSRVVGAIAEALVGARRRGAPEIDAEAVILAAYLHDIGRSPLLAGDPRDHNILSGLVLAAEGLDACVEPARRHAVYTVLDPVLAPRTAAEKLVYVADRRGGWVSRLTSRGRAISSARGYPREAHGCGATPPRISSRDSAAKARSFSWGRIWTRYRKAAGSTARSASSARSRRSSRSSTPTC